MRVTCTPAPSSRGCCWQRHHRLPCLSPARPPPLDLALAGHECHRGVMPRAIVAEQRVGVGQRRPSILVHEHDERVPARAWRPSVIPGHKSERLPSTGHLTSRIRSGQGQSVQAHQVLSAHQHPRVPSPDPSESRRRTQPRVRAPCHCASHRFSSGASCWSAAATADRRSATATVPSPPGVSEALR